MSAELTTATVHNAEIMLAEMRREVELRDHRIRRLEELNAQLAKRIDELELEKRNENVPRSTV